MDYGKTISRAWEITWRNKWLWLLGFLAALTSGSGGGGGGGGGGNTGFQFDQPGGVPTLPEGPLGDFLRQLEAGDPGAIVGLLGGLAVVFAVLCLIGIVLWFVSQAARAGLILAVDRIERGDNWQFGPALRSGATLLLPVFLFKLLVGILPVLVGVGAAVIGVSSIFAFASDAQGFGGTLIVLACLTVCLILPLVFVLQFIDGYGYRGLVLRRLGVIDAIKHGWQTFRDHLGDSLILGVIVTVIGGVVGFLIFLVLAPFLALIAIPLFGYFQSGSLGAGETISIIGGALGFIVLGALLASVLTTWRSAVFTLAYRDFTGLAAPKAAPVPPTDPFGEIGPEKSPDQYI